MPASIAYCLKDPTIVFAAVDFPEATLATSLEKAPSTQVTNLHNSANANKNIVRVLPLLHNSITSRAGLHP